MFVLQSEPRWTWPVVVKHPGPDGAVAEHRFSAVWRLVPPEDRERLGLTEAGTDQLLRQSIVQVNDVVDENRQPIAHSKDLLDALIRNPWVRRGLIEAYANALAGMPPAAAVGN